MKKNKTLIVPCAGKSSRYPGLRPKYLLTYPDGKLMIEKAIGNLISFFDKVIITILKEHDEKYEASLILTQLFGDSIEIHILPEQTKSQSETVYKTIIDKTITGEIVIKDSDNLVEYSPVYTGNFIVGADLNKFSVSNIQNKSYIINQDSIIKTIEEKQVISSIICVGVYGFDSATDFCETYELLNKNNNSELYVSLIIKQQLLNKEFKLILCDNYEDWGTLVEWEKIQKTKSTYFIDIDGVILRNYGKYGSKNWSNTTEPLIENILRLKQLQEAGAQIFFISARPESYRKDLDLLFKSFNLSYAGLILDCNHAPRIIVNDFAQSNPYPSCNAISLPRNGNLNEYI